VLYRDQSIHVVTWAKRFLFRIDQLDTPVSRLSGGEQARILIAQLMRQPADILLLDEPTNDLDISAIEVLEDSLLDFPGAIVLVSHDRTFLDNITSEIIGFSGQGRVEHYADYNQWLKAQQPEAKPRKKIKKIKPKSTRQKKLTFKEKQELAAMEENIMMVEEELDECRQQLAVPEVMNDQEALAKWCARLQQCQEEADRLYERWDELEKKREISADA
jgi:ATP-binding cassette subfamily F protein uup